MELFIKKATFLVYSCVVVVTAAVVYVVVVAAAPYNPPPSKIQCTTLKADIEE